MRTRSPRSTALWIIPSARTGSRRCYSVAHGKHDDTSRLLPLREPDLDRLRQPPANTEAEQALLGAMLINNAAYHRVAEFLLPEHFGNAVHGRIYAAIGKLIERGQIADPVTLKNLFDQDGALADIGGAQYLGRSPIRP